AMATRWYPSSTRPRTRSPRASMLARHRTAWPSPPMAARSLSLASARTRLRRSTPGVTRLSGRYRYPNLTTSPSLLTDRRRMPHWIAATSDNHCAYVTNEKSNDVSVVDLSASKVTATMPVGNAPRKIVMQSGVVGVSPAAQAAPAAQRPPAPQAPAPAAASPQGQAVDVSISKFAFVPATA